MIEFKRAATTLALVAGLGVAVFVSAQQIGGEVPVWKGPDGPIDLGLRDPVLVGALDLHTHLDPDMSGGGQVARAMDTIDMARQARARGMRGFALKTHMDVSSAASAYYAREAVPGVEAFGRFVMNLPVGGLNPAAVMQFVSINGGWGRIVEFPTRDARPRQPENRPWVAPWLSLFPGRPNYVPIVEGGELTDDAKGIIELVSRIRTEGSNGTVVIATGHATPEGHVLITREARRLGVPTLITHPNDTVSDAQYQEMKELGAFFEVLLDFYQGDDEADAKIAFALKQIERLGAESIVLATDCGQLNNPLPADCIVLGAQALRARGVSESQLDMMLKENPARLLGLPQTATR
ncbi:MAG: DUF6282 family protein [Gammaproteobacteria bacterium]|nr:DUF6282 family protein [Gammaproteobacteria bacterium]